MRIGIVGAGIAGLACAEGLLEYKCDVVLLDKGRGPGGRMSTRRVPTAAGEVGFDHGAQYFTVHAAEFSRRVESWISDRVVAPWPAAGPEAYVGLPAMSAPIKQMAIGKSIRFLSQVVQMEKSDSKWQLVLDQRESIQVDIVVVATPAEQAGALLASAAPDFAARAAAIRSTPCWTTMLAFAEPLALDQDCLRGDDEDALAWAARNSAKPGRTGPEAWVLQASPDWSRAHLEADADWVSTALSAVFSQRLGTALPPPIASVSHRWRYANAFGQTSSLAWDAERRIGLCGDWLGGGCVEAAWLSGTRLAAQIAGNLPTGLPQHSSIRG